jgi:formamidopyrimidine-DNA glycosylase
MPEGPEVERVRQTLGPRIVGQRIETTRRSSKKLRKSLGASALAKTVGQVFGNPQRHGKALYLRFEGGGGLGVHLGMSGRLLSRPPGAHRVPHTHVVLSLSDQSQIWFVDPRRFGSVSVFDDDGMWQKSIAHLGPDPLLWSGVQMGRARVRAKKSTRTVKAILLDQAVVAGVGNIYACEALFAAGIHPAARGHRLSHQRWAQILEALPKIFGEALAYGGTTFSQYVDGEGRAGENLKHLAVFMKAGTPCPRCATEIRRITQSGRSTFFCPGSERPRVG